VNKLRAEKGRGSTSGRCNKLFFSPKYPIHIWNPYSLISNKYVQGVISPEIEQRGLETEDALPYIAQVNNEYGVEI